MSEETKTGGMPDGGAPDGGMPNGDGGQPTAAELAAELERVKAALKTANSESASRRKRLEELEAAEAERTAAQLSEVEKAKKLAADAEVKAQAAEERLRTAMVRNAVVVAASKLNFYDPEDAFRLADLGEAQVGEDGKVTGVEDALKTLAKAKPHLVKAAGTAGSLNSTEGGRQTRPSADEMIQRKRAAGGYAPI